MGEDDLALAHALADVADSISLGWFRRRPDVTTKVDGTAVSQADLEIDETLSTMLRHERPTDEVLSEESGSRSINYAPPGPAGAALDP